MPVRSKKEVLQTIRARFQQLRLADLVGQRPLIDKAQCYSLGLQNIQEMEYRELLESEITARAGNGELSYQPRPKQGVLKDDSDDFVTEIVPSGGRGGVIRVRTPKSML